MANETNRRSSIVSKFTQSISDRITQLRQSSSFLPSNIADDTSYITQNINDEIDLLISHNEEIEGEANIANLYNRFENKTDKDGKTISLDSIFNSRQLSEQIMPSFIQNRQLLEYEEMIDTIVKYFPTMQDVLNVKKDHVLCADHYTKDFINVTDLMSSKSTNDEEASVFQQNIQYIKEKYNLVNQFDKMYDITAKYGECFVYIKGYNDAIGELLKNKNKNPAFQSESSFVLNECFASNNNPIKTIEDKDYSDYINNLSKLEFNISYNKYGYIPSAINEASNVREILTEEKGLGLNAYKQFKNIVPNKLGFEGVQDGLIDKGNLEEDNNSNKNYDQPKLDLKGCIVRKLKRENIIPLYFDDDTVVGYFYIEVEIQKEIKEMVKNNASPFRGNMANMSSIFNNVKAEERRNILTFISDKLSKLIDAKFVKDNQDLKKEIYLVLKNSQMLDKNQTQINATFISPNDIIHMKFEEDPMTHRGVSDLDKSIVPASMYVNLYTTNTIGILTRGFDKRVYYVKNRVDTNIARTLLNVMNQLRRGNMGAREIANPKTALGITGRYNDYLIPVGQSGDPPVTIENMPGQDIDTKQELMETLKELAVGPTDVPLDYVDQSKNVDFATRLTMSSYKFLRSIYKRQSQTNPFFTRILQKIYDYEFPQTEDNNNKRVKLKVVLPSPVYINQMNIAEVFRVVNEYSQQLAEVEYVNQNDPLLDIKKKIFISQYTKEILGSQLDVSILKKSKDYADLHATEFSQPQENNM